MAARHLHLVPPPAPEYTRDDEAEARVAATYLEDKRVRAIVESNPNRKVFLTRDGKVTREVTAAYVLAALIARHKLAEELADPEAFARAKTEREIKERRARGEPDLCATCGKPLGMGLESVRLRSRVDPLRWFCRTCAIRQIPPDQRRESARKGAESLTPEQRAERARKISESVKEEHASKTPEQRAEQAKKAYAALTPEQRAERARRISAARRAKRTARRGGPR